MRLALALGVLMALTVEPDPCAAARPMTIDDLLAVKGVADPQVSPDGKLVVYVVSELDRATDKTNSDLWLVPIEGGEPRRLTTAPGTDNHPRWSPDGKTIAFASNRGGTTQVWLLPIDGGEARPLTKLPIDVAGPIWSRQGDQIAFAAEVYPGKTPEETAAKDKEKDASKSKARVYDHLMIRHWSAWDEGKRSHLFVADAVTGEAKDLTPKLDVNTPPAPFGGSSDYTFAPDGKSLVFVAEPLKDLAWSTNTDLWSVSTDGGELKNLTADNPGADAQPAFSPDGRLLAWVRQGRAGFESDQWVLTFRDLDSGRTNELTRELDRPVQSFVWSRLEVPKIAGPGRVARRPGLKAGPSRVLYAVIDDAGALAVASVLLEEAPVGALVQTSTVLSKGGSVSGGIAVTPGTIPEENALVFVRSAVGAPGELYRAGANGVKPTPLTRHNAPLTAGLDLPKAEKFAFPGAGGDLVSGWLIRPPAFDDKKTYPVVFLIHGGPQGAWHDEWHNRWNYAMFAARGHAVVALNPRGSTGYGQTFTDQISRDWTGKVYDDLMKGLDHALKTYPFLDGDRVAAAGGSYGGFMVNWIAGHTDRFKCLISHAGVFDLTSKYGTTEELWFPEWEFGGPPWEQAEHYRERSPSAFVKNFKTPTLVIHGALDFRVPDAQGLGMFTALQRRGVPSRYLFFPDEGHWILKPANRIVWWREMNDWLGKYLKPSAEK